MFCFRSHGSNVVDPEDHRIRSVTVKQIQVIREGQEGKAFQPVTSGLHVWPPYLLSHTAFPISYIRFAWLACNMFSATSNVMLLITLRSNLQEKLTLVTEPLKVVAMAFWFVYCVGHIWCPYHVTVSILVLVLRDSIENQKLPILKSFYGNLSHQTIPFFVKNKLQRITNENAVIIRRIWKRSNQPKINRCNWKSLFFTLFFNLFQLHR